MKLLFTTLLFLSATGFALAQQKPEGLFINSKAFDFKAKDQHGKDISLKDLRKKGPVVIVFYRGNWCPYCNKELKRLTDSLHLIAEKGAQLVAITPEGSAGVQKTTEKTGAGFPIVSDSEMKISDKYRVAFEVDGRSLSRYKNAGIDLLQINQQKHAQLPVPAVYIINKDGTVTFRYFNEDYKKRIWVQQILNEL